MQRWKNLTVHEESFDIFQECRKSLPGTTPTTSTFLLALVDVVVNDHPELAEDIAYRARQFQESGQNGSRNGKSAGSRNEEEVWFEPDGE